MNHCRMRMRFYRASATLLLVLIACPGSFAAKKKADVDPRLKNIHSIFIAGNNPTTINARQNITDERFVRRFKVCFNLAEKADQADATLEISESRSRPNLYVDSTYASGTLTLKTGELVWSYTLRFPEDVANLRAVGILAQLRKAVCGN
jgi:hypothetical protein